MASRSGAASARNSALTRSWCAAYGIGAPRRTGLDAETIRVVISDNETSHCDMRMRLGVGPGAALATHGGRDVWRERRSAGDAARAME
nr:hypothetical protein GCM10020063_048310 [Dactylosporangium thailandense]